MKMKEIITDRIHIKHNCIFSASSYDVAPQTVAEDDIHADRGEQVILLYL